MLGEKVMSNENNEKNENQEAQEIKKIELSVTDFEKKVDEERAYLIRDGMSPEKAKKKAIEIVRKTYKEVNVSIDYSNWAGQKG